MRRFEPPPRLDLDEDAEELEGVGGAHDQVVVGVEAAVEVERAQLPSRSSWATMNSTFVPGCVMTGVQADHSTLAEAPLCVYAVPQSGTSVW